MFHGACCSVAVGALRALNSRGRDAVDSFVLRRGFAAFACAWLVMAAPSRDVVAAPPVGGAAVIEASRRADVAVVTYRELLGEIGDADHGPVLRIYGDGRMVAHYPAYLRRAGDYEQRLAPGELDRLLRSLGDKGVLDFDVAAVRAATRASVTAAHQRARQAGAPVTVFEAVDAATTVIEVNLDRYRGAAPGARDVRGLAKRVVWTGVRADAEHHPDVAAIQKLAAGEQELRALRERPGFTRLR